MAEIQRNIFGLRVQLLQNPLRHCNEIAAGSDVHYVSLSFFRLNLLTFLLCIEAASYVEENTQPWTGLKKCFAAEFLMSLILLEWLLVVGSKGIIPSECLSHRWSDPNEPG